MDVGTAWSHTRFSVDNLAYSCTTQLGDRGDEQLLEFSPGICPCHIQAEAVTLEKTFALRDTRLVEVNLNWLGKQVSKQCADIYSS